MCLYTKNYAGNSEPMSVECIMNDMIYETGNLSIPGGFTCILLKELSISF